MAAELGLRREMAVSGEGFGGREGAERGEGRGIYRGGVDWEEGEDRGEDPEDRGIRRWRRRGLAWRGRRSSGQVNQK